MFNRRIELTVFLSGAVLMALEIAGGRLLTPDYGGTIFVWGSIIGIILGGLSLGYYFGGNLADKRPNEMVLALILAAAGVLTIIIPFAYDFFVGLFSSLPKNFAPLATLSSLFLVPSVLLGMVSPFAIKLKAKSIDNLGGLSGNLYAIATLGSVLGTFLATFVLLIILPLPVVFLGLGLTLLLSAVILANKKQFQIAGVVFILLLLLGFVMGVFTPTGAGSPAETDIETQQNNFENEENNFSQVPETTPENADFVPLETSWLENTEAEQNEWKSRLKQQAVAKTFESVYGPVRVGSSGNQRRLFISGGVMGGITIQTPLTAASGWEYLDCFGNSFAAKPDIKDVLVLGVGAGIFPTKASIKQNVYIDAVDINDKVLFAAQEYFGLQESENLKIHNEDARVFLNNTDKKYDLIVVDVFKYRDGLYRIPFHLVTKEFFELSKEHLNPDGILGVMFVTDKEMGNSAYYLSEYKTVVSTFENNYNFDCDEQIILSSDSELDFENTNLALAGYSYTLEADPDAIIFTDDFVPVDVFEEISYPEN